MANKLSIGVGWSSHFMRSGLKSLLYRKLRYAYRAPAFFAEAMLADNADIKFLRFDASPPISTGHSVNSPNQSNFSTALRMVSTRPTPIH